MGATYETSGCPLNCPVLCSLQRDLAALYNNRGACYRAMDQNHEVLAEASKQT